MLIVAEDYAIQSGNALAADDMAFLLYEFCLRTNFNFLPFNELFSIVSSLHCIYCGGILSGSCGIALIAPKTNLEWLFSGMSSSCYGN